MFLDLSEIRNPELYLGHPSYILQQKADGVRIGLWVKDGRVRGLSKRHTPLSVPKPVRTALAAFSSDSFVVEGELVGDHLWLFDIWAWGEVDLSAQSLENRLSLLRVFDILNSPHLHVLPHWKGAQKRLAFQTLRDHRAEGVVFKHLTEPHWHKHKFVATVDVVVMGNRPDRRDSKVVGLYRDGELVEVGHCTAYQNDLRYGRPGDVFELKVLGVTDDNRLREPTNPRRRYDKLAEDCGWDQLESARKTKELYTGSLYDSAE
jgi:ATP-dependent DNA ligase